MLAVEMPRLVTGAVQVQGPNGLVSSCVLGSAELTARRGKASAAATTVP